MSFFDKSGAGRDGDYRVSPVYRCIFNGIFIHENTMYIVLIYAQLADSSATQGLKFLLVYETQCNNTMFFSMKQCKRELVIY